MFLTRETIEFNSCVDCGKLEAKTRKERPNSTPCGPRVSAGELHPSTEAAMTMFHDAPITHQPRRCNDVLVTGARSTFDIPLDCGRAVRLEAPETEPDSSTAIAS